MTNHKNALPSLEVTRVHPKLNLFPNLDEEAMHAMASNIEMIEFLRPVIVDRHCRQGRHSS